MMAVLLGALAGGLMGSAAGLVPGLHPNAVAALLLGALPALPLLPEPLAAAVVAMGLAHLLGSAIPATFLGAPAPEQGLQVLPAQRMLHEGRAVEAVELAVLGACVGALAALLLAAPLRLLLGPEGEGYRWLEPVLPVGLVALVVVLLGTEGKRVPSRRAIRALPFHEAGHATLTGTLRARRGDVLHLDTGRIHDPLGLFDQATPGASLTAGGPAVRVEGPEAGGLGVLLAAAVFGWAALLGIVGQRIPAPSPLGLPGSTLFPLLTGLFGAPALLLALRSPLPPPQPVLASAMPLRSLLATGAVGGVCGALAGLLPGLSTSAGSVLAGVVRPTRGHEDSLVTLSAAASSETVLGSLALVLMGRARSGSMLVVQQLVPPAPSAWPLLLCGLAGGLAVGVPCTLLAARALAPRFHRLPYRALSAGVVLALAGMTWCFTGPAGLALLGLAALVGLLPWWWGVRRGHLMGCLLGPLLLSAWS